MIVFRSCEDILARRWGIRMERDHERGIVVMRGPTDQIERLKTQLYEEKNPVVGALVMGAKKLFEEGEIEKSVDEILRTEFPKDEEENEGYTLDDLIREKQGEAVKKKLEDFERKSKGGGSEQDED